MLTRVNDQPYLWYEPNSRLILESGFKTMIITIFILMLTQVNSQHDSLPEPYMCLRLRIDRVMVEKEVLDQSWAIHGSNEFFFILKIEIYVM